MGVSFFFLFLFFWGGELGGEVPMMSEPQPILKELTLVSVMGNWVEVGPKWLLDIPEGLYLWLWWGMVVGGLGVSK